ncbi:carboxymuconolactone decarboxylase family protein [Afifella pfennigii]|uniref:carboxymuconolactone decarboxylase family protein n=1 Tax=Afifella pfennigii TaxID=209897 RepID=UPI00068C6211|nr:carboxymuconolactone decarboxylase family protein [Afifella pfennigii]
MSQEDAPRAQDIRFPRASRAHAEQRKALAPEPDAAFKAFSKAVFAEGALSGRAKQLIAVAVAHVTQCPWCIEGHVKAARRAGASAEEIMEAIWVAAEMRAGAAFAHSVKTLEILGDETGR